MQKTTKIFVPFDKLKNEAKTIFKNNNKVIEYSKILNIIIFHLNFDNLTEYNKIYKKQINQSDDFYIKSYLTLKTETLAQIESDLINDFHQLNLYNTKTIYFLRNLINQRLKNFVKKETDLNIIQTLSVLRYIKPHYINLIKNDYSIDRKLFLELKNIFIYTIKETKINNKNLFKNYSLLLNFDNLNEGIDIILNNKNITTFKSTLNDIVYRMFQISLKDNNSNNIGEGFLFNLLFQHYNNVINEKELYNFVIKRIEQEKENYNNTLNVFSEKEINKIDFPTLIYTDKSNEDLVLSFKEKTNSNNPLFLGKEDIIIKKSLFNKKKNLLLNIRESKENKLIVSSVMSNKDVLIENIIFQHMINNKSIIYFETTNNPNTYAKIYYLSQIAKRNNDIVFLNIEEKNISNIIYNLYLKNKIIIILFNTPLEKTKDTYIKEIQKNILQTIKLINKTKNKISNLKDLFIINEVGRLFRCGGPNNDISNKIKESTFALNNKNLSFVFGIFDYYGYHDNFISAFPIHFLYKQYDPRIDIIYSSNIMLKRDLMQLDLGQFFISRASKGRVYIENLTLYKNHNIDINIPDNYSFILKNNIRG